MTGALMVALAVAGCATVRQVPWTRVDGTSCLTTKVNPVWYSSESETDCMDKSGKVETVATNHEDIGIVGYAVAAVIGIAAAS